jgi:hypothetical protein
MDVFHFAARFSSWLSNPVLSPRALATAKRQGRLFGVFTSIDLYSVIDSNNLPSLFQLLPDAFGFHIRMRFTAFDRRRIRICTLFITSIDLFSVVNGNDFPTGVC